MKKINLALIVLCTLLFSVQSQAGMTLGGMEQSIPNPDAQPNSKAFGKSLDEWVKAHLRWLEAGQEPDVRVKNVAFLPIMGESPFDVEMEPGTALVLPIALWLGFEGDPVLDPSDFYGEVLVDGQPVAEPNEDYYVGPTIVDPPLFDVVIFYQGLAVVIKPLTPGSHTIHLISSIGDDDSFNNTWNIHVTPPGKKVQ